MTTLEIDATDIILVLRFNIKMQNYKQSSVSIKDFIDETLQKKLSNSIIYQINENVTGIGTLFETIIDDHGCLAIVPRGEREPSVLSIHSFDVPFRVVDGSIIIKDGEIRINAKSAALILILLTGGFNFFADYEDAVDGAGLFLHHLQIGYERVLRSLASQGDVSENEPRETPTPDQVARTVLQNVREEEMRKRIEHYLQHTSPN